MIDERIVDCFPKAWDQAFCTAYAEEHLGMDLVKYGSQSHEPEVFHSEFCLAALTNLKNLTFHVDNSEKERSYTILYNHAQELECVPTLSRLQTLTIQPTDFGFSFGVHCTNPGIRMLIKRTPKLRHLRLTNLIVTATIPQWLESQDVDGVTPRTCGSFVKDMAASLTDVRTLELINCGIQDDDVSSDSTDEFNWLHDIINNCRSLERFVFGDFITDEYVTQRIVPARVLDALSCKVKTLRELDLEMEKRCSATRRLDEHVCRSDQLIRFEQLEMLRIHGDAYCLCGTENEDGDVEHSCLTKLLPPSVRLLGLYMKWSGSWEDVFQLADYVREGHFPKLEQLEVIFKDLDLIRNPDEEWHKAIEVVDAFRDTDIHISVKAANSYGHPSLPKFRIFAESE